MRALRIVLVAFVALVALLALAVVFVVPRLLDDPAIRDALQQRAAAALERDVGFRSMHAELFPPAIALDDVWAAADDPADRPLLEARRVSLRLAWVPLLARQVVIDELVLEEPTLRIALEPEASAAPGSTPGGAATATDEAPGLADQEGAGSGSEGVALLLRRLQIVDGRAVFEDRSARPFVTWVLEDLQASARGSVVGAPIRFDASASPSEGGRIEASGEAQLSRELEARIELDSVALSPGAALLARSASGPEPPQLAGRASGHIEVRGPASEPESIAVQVSVPDAEMRFDDLFLRGPVDVRADLAGFSTGTFEVDATRARLDYGGGAYQKPAGIPAVVSGRLLPGADGTTIEELRVVVKNLDARGRLELREDVELTLRSAPFDATGWGEIAPVLAPYAPSGPVALRDFRVTTSPLRFGGAIGLEGVRVTPAGEKPLLLRGAIRGERRSLVLDALDVAAGDQSLQVTGRITDLDGEPRFDLDLRPVENVEANALVSAFGDVRDTVFGPLSLSGKLSGVIPEQDSLWNTLDGQLSFQIGGEPGRGRLAGVSVLRSLFTGLEGKGDALLRSLLALRGRTLEQFFGEEFELMASRIVIQKGIARTDDFRMLYDDYRLDAKGAVRLEDFALDLTCRLDLGEKIVAKLGLGSGRSVIPVGVAGTLWKPKLVATPETLAVASRLLVPAKTRGEIDAVLGEGSGKVVTDLLGELLKGKK